MSPRRLLQGALMPRSSSIADQWQEATCEQSQKGPAAHLFVVSDSSDLSVRSLLGSKSSAQG